MTANPEKVRRGLRALLRSDDWDIDLTAMSAGRSLPLRIVRVVRLVVRGFTEDDLAVHASALTFVTLMSLVPMLAVAFALLKGFGFGQDEIGRLMEWRESMPVEFQQFVNQILSIVNSTNFAALGWVGLGFVVFTAVLVLGSVEVSFDRIWGVTTSRGLVRKTANYISILVLVPLLIGIGGTLQATLKGGLAHLLEPVGFGARSALRFTSLFSAWLAFYFLYTFLPNTRVKAGPAVFGSLFGAVAWVIWQKAYISLQIGVARYNAIYGTFASVPIFLFWLYVGWVVILLGAELAFALQNASTFQFESAADRANAKSRLLLALTVLAHAAEALAGNRTRFEAGAFARAHRVPIRLLNDVIRVLTRAGLLAETAGKQGTYVLLKAAESVRIRDVVEVVLQDGAGPEKLGLQTLSGEVAGILDSISAGFAQAAGERTVADLVKSGTDSISA
jgi:membrane protein